MPIDFSKLPPEEPLTDQPPSRLVWTIVFFVIVLAGVFAVLRLWPKDEPTQTLWFWTCVTVYPAGVAAFVVMRRYRVFEGRRMDAIAWNDARQAYINGVFDQASRPLAVLATTFRFSTDAKEDDSGKVLDDSVKLEPQIAPNHESQPVSARWFEVQDGNGTSFKRDDERRLHVLTWAFGTVADSVADAVRALPPELNLRVQLVLSGIANTQDALDIWNRQWETSSLRYAQAGVSATAPDLMYVDAWLDRINQRFDEEARLLVFVRLNAVQGALPPDGSAEAVVAILFVPEVVCRKFDLVPVAMLHRPNGMSDCPIDEALARALRWGNAKPAEISRMWKSGLDAVDSNAATKTFVTSGIGGKTMNLDDMVGHAGEVAPWFVTACAARGAVHDRTPQLVVATGKAGVYFSVIRNSG